MTAETPRPQHRPHARPRLRVPRFLRWWEHEDEEVAEERILLVRILIAVVWLPIQITLSLLFATGGLFLLLILGIALAPLIGIGFLVWSVVRKAGSGGERAE